MVGTDEFTEVRLFQDSEELNELVTMKEATVKLGSSMQAFLTKSVRKAKNILNAFRERNDGVAHSTDILPMKAPPPTLTDFDFRPYTEDHLHHDLDYAWIADEADAEKWVRAMHVLKETQFDDRELSQLMFWIRPFTRQKRLPRLHVQQVSPLRLAVQCIQLLSASKGEHTRWLAASLRFHDLRSESRYKDHAVTAMAAIELFQTCSDRGTQEALYKFASKDPCPTIRASAVTAISTRCGDLYRRELAEIANLDPSELVRQASLAFLGPRAGMWPRQPPPPPPSGMIEPVLVGPPPAVPAVARTVAPVRAPPIAGSSPYLPAQRGSRSQRRQNRTHTVSEATAFGTPPIRQTVPAVSQPSEAAQADNTTQSGTRLVR